MLKHLVFFNMKDEGEKTTENARKMVSMLRSLPAAIPQIAELNCGINVKDGAAACDVALYTAFASEEDLEIYRNHPAHLKVVDFIGKVTSQRWFVDYLSE